MFQFFRRKDAAVRWFLGGLLVVVCLTMVITLIPGVTTPSASSDTSVLGTVGSESVTLQQVQAQFQLVTRDNRIPAQFFGIYAPQILKQIQDEKALDFEAHRLGLDVSKEEVAANLRSNPGLFPGGVFIGVDRYREIVESRMGTTVEAFEANLGQEILRGKLRHLVTDAITVSDLEADADYRRKNDKIKVDYVLLEESKFTNDVKLDEADMKAFFERTKENFRLTERRKLKMAVLDLAKIRENTEVKPEELRSYYERNRDTYRVAERVRVSHILIKTVDRTAEQQKEAEKKINDLLVRARKGEDFAALAKANSEDTVSAEKGGDVDWVKHGQMVAEFEKMAFALEIGKISDVVKTQYGFHILKVTAREQAHQRTLPEVQAEILPKVKAEKSERAEQLAVDQLEAALRKNPKTVEALAADLKLPVLEDPGHERGGAFAGLGAAPSADEAVFALKAPGEMTGPVTVNQQKAVFQLVEILPSRLPEMSEVRDRVEKDYKTAKVKDLFAARSKEFGERVKALGDLKKAAKEKKYEVKTSADLNVTGRIEELGASPDFPAAAFKMKVGETAGPVKGRGDMFYQLTEKTMATAEDAAKNRETTRQELLAEKRGAFFSVYMEELRARLTKEKKLTTNDEAIKRLQASFQP